MIIEITREKLLKIKGENFSAYQIIVGLVGETEISVDTQSREVERPQVMGEFSKHQNLIDYLKEKPGAQICIGVREDNWEYAQRLLFHCGLGWMKRGKKIIPREDAKSIETNGFSIGKILYKNSDNYAENLEYNLDAAKFFNESGL